MKKEKSQAYCPAEHDEKLIFEIGRITAKHAMLEALITDIIAFVIKATPKQSIALSTHLGLKSKIDIAKSLTHETDMEKKQKEYLLKTLSEAEKISKKRNEFTHRLIGYSGSEENGLHSYIKSARGTEIKEKQTKISSGAAKKVADELGSVNLRLIRVVIGDTPWN